MVSGMGDPAALGAKGMKANLTALRGARQTKEVTSVPPGAPPLDSEHVHVSFLRDDFESAVAEWLKQKQPKLGAQGLHNDEKLVTTLSVKALALDKEFFNLYQLDQHGFALHQMPEWFKVAFEGVVQETVRQLRTSDTLSSDYQRFYDHAAPLLLEQLVTDFFDNDASTAALRREYPRGVIVKCSKTMKPRSSTTLQDGQFVIPPNTLLHTDYYNPEASYKRQCLNQEQWTDKMECPPFSDFIDHWNVWFPLVTVLEWPLGFLAGNVDFAQHVPVEMVAASTAASLKYDAAASPIVYKKGMTWGEMYLFRSGSSKRGLGPMHTSFRISAAQAVKKPANGFQRLSLEGRCMVFKKPVPAPHGLPGA